LGKGRSFSDIIPSLDAFSFYYTIDETGKIVAMGKQMPNVGHLIHKFLHGQRLARPKARYNSPPCLSIHQVHLIAVRELLNLRGLISGRTNNSKYFASDPAKPLKFHSYE